MGREKERDLDRVLYRYACNITDIDMHREFIIRGVHKLSTVCTKTS